jgi:LacI family gluconate utilization system Gnt-I transcriptional repressor
VFSDVLKGIYAAIAATPFDVQLGNTHYSVLQEEQLIKLFLSQRPARLVVTGIDQSDSARRMLQNADCPVVQIMECGSTPIDMGIGFSQQDAAGTAVKHLIEQGYRKIGFLGARMDPRTQRRLNGYVNAMRQSGLYDEQLVVTTPQPSTVALGGVLLGDLLSIQPQADAVFCNNDDLALGVLFECQRRRIRVGEQIGICGFNDLDYMHVSVPPMSTVRTYRQEMGKQAIEMLLAAIHAKPDRQRIVDIGFALMTRESSRRI